MSEVKTEPKADVKPAAPAPAPTAANPAPVKAKDLELIKDAPPEKGNAKDAKVSQPPDAEKPEMTRAAQKAAKIQAKEDKPKSLWRQLDDLKARVEAAHHSP